MRTVWSALILLLVFASPASAETPWWNAAWRCRREVVFPEKTDANVFEVVFPNHGVGRPDGRDVRVVAGGAELPLRVLSVGPGDTVHVVFERRGEAPHFIYWDHPAASAARSTPIRAGCLLEVKSYPGETIESLAQVRRAWAAGRRQGACFVPNIHFQFNPLGPNTNFLSRYVGYFRCARRGRYLFATDSDDASFLMIDGKLVTEWPGTHGTARQARYTGSVDLDVGVHEIEYLHAQGDGGVLMNAAWRPPGSPRPEIIPTSAFVPVDEAGVKQIERRGHGPVPDFLPTNVGQAVLTPDAEEFLVKMHFENLTASPALDGFVCRWFFGDGTTSTETSPDHVYLSAGDYDVALVLVKGYDERKLTMKVHVARDWSRQASTIDLREHYYDIVKTYDISRIKPRQAYLAMYYFERIAKRDDAVRAGRVLLSRANGLPEETLFDAVKLFAETMRVLGKDYGGARQMLLAWEKRMKNPEHAAGLALAAGDIDMWHLKDLDGAEANYRRVIFTYAEKARRETLRRALVRMGDIYRWRPAGGAGGVPRQEHRGAARTRRHGIRLRVPRPVGVGVSRGPARRLLDGTPREMAHRQQGIPGGDRRGGKPAEAQPQDPVCPDATVAGGRLRRGGGRGAPRDPAPRACPHPLPGSAQPGRRAETHRETEETRVSVHARCTVFPETSPVILL